MGLLPCLSPLLLCLGVSGLTEGDSQLAAQLAAAQLAAAPKFRLRDGGVMPSIALGTSGLNDAEATSAVDFALRAGYRAVDTAIVYENHEAVGRGLRLSGVPRESLFLISKIPADMHGYARGREAVQRMLRELETPYVDLCLIHYPGMGWPWIPSFPAADAKVIVERAGTWHALEKAYEEGRCRHIGVSNYMPAHIEELLDYAVVPPVVNQIEYHPYYVDGDTVKVCQKYGIVVQAYGSINADGLLGDPVVASIAADVGRSPGQVLLRWALQEGVMVLPKSSRSERILENARLWDFALSSRQQSQLKALHHGRKKYLSSSDIPAMSFPGKRPWGKWRRPRNASIG